MPELRPYQIEDVEFLSQIPHAACFNEQRTGKTPTALTVMQKHGCKRLVIICPASAVYQWTEEYIRWTGQPCVALIGDRNKRDKLLDKWTHGLVVSYDTFKKTARSTGAAEKILRKNPEGVILDEAHRIKNPRSEATKAAMTCRNIAYRLALTGTPAPNKAHEIYSILAWLWPDTFPSYWRFIDDYFEKSTQFGSGRTYIEVGGFQPGKAKELQLILSRISTQRKRKDVMAWLPEKDYTQIRLPVTREQNKYLYELSQYFETENIITQGVLDRLVRYRQICLHPRLLGLRGASPKLDWIKQYIRDYPETPTIIFSKFTSFIKILKDELAGLSIGVIIGSTPLQERNTIVNAFQRGDLKRLIINIDAGKEALTLDRAETIIFTDKYPPIGDILQAEDRFVSTTEDKADKPHRIIELMMKDTYDEQLYKLLQERKSETDIINDYRRFLSNKA